MKYLRKLILKNDFIALCCLRVYRYYLNSKAGITIGKKSIIGFSSEFEGFNIIGENTKFLSSKIGYGSYISEHSQFQNASIGKFCSIGPYVRCIFGNHPTHTFVTTHPSFFSIRKQAGFTFVKNPLFNDFSASSSPYNIHIGNDVWIGANVSILDGITIGDGAIVAANALVNKDVPPYSIVGGVPAKHIKYRFTPEQIAFMLQFKWWDKEVAWLESHAMDFQNIAEFIKKHSHA